MKAVIELATLNEFTASHLAFLEQLTASIGIVLNSIEATMQTEGLLKQSQQLATELQTQQKELQQTNEQLGQKAQQLAEQNAEVERKNQEIEQARRALEDKAKELALTSKYKSEFLANMSHELRTPLNSILVLGQQLTDNPDGNLSPRQVEYARTIHGAGTDLLNLISDILDLSKIESGTVSVDAEEVFFGSLLDMLARPFRHEAENRKVSFEVDAASELPRSLVTDSKRLQQVLKNLLSNAFKFTEKGSVRLKVAPVSSGWSDGHPILNGAGSVIAFEVSDTGIGIPQDKQRIIFEAFQQADAGTSRKYGGTGLGLAISRELASLLGGEIQLRSTPGQGSTFTLYIPQTYVGTAAPTVAASEGTSGYVMPRLQLPVANVEQIVERLEDDRTNVEPGDNVLLVVEDDPHYARLLCDLAREKGFKVLIAMRGAEALSLAREFRPTAVTLDVFLPDMARLGGSEPSEAGSGDTAYSGANADDGRGLASRPVARGVLVCGKAHEPGRAGGGAESNQGVLVATTQKVADCRGQSRGTVHHRGVAGLRGHRHYGRRYRRRCAGKGRAGDVRLRGSGPSTAGHVRSRGAGADAAVAHAH